MNHPALNQTHRRTRPKRLCEIWPRAFLDYASSELEPAIAKARLQSALTACEAAKSNAAYQAMLITRKTT